MSQVVIYNAGGGQVLGKVSVRHAITMLHRQVARVLDACEGQQFGPHPMPRSVELLRWVHAGWVYARTGRPPYSKANVLRRDRYKCAYCSKPGVTIDHIVPRSKGGPSTWLNSVASCQGCNESKADLTLTQAGMSLGITPFVPTMADLYPPRRKVRT